MAIIVAGVMLRVGGLAVRGVGPPASVCSLFDDSRLLFGGILSFFPLELTWNLLS